MKNLFLQLSLVATMALSTQTTATAGAFASADVELNGGGCSSPGKTVGIPSGGPNSKSATAGGGGGGCTATATGFSYAGVVGSNAQAGFGSSHSGSDTFMSGTGVGVWQDALTAVMFRQVSVDVDTLQLNFSLGATGGVSATGSRSDPGLNPLATGSATISYEFSLAGVTFGGTESQGSFAPVVTTGRFGTVAGSVRISPNGESNGLLTFASIPLIFRGEARAAIVNAFNVGERSASASANFSSTLRWLGITSVQAFDAQGREISLPQDFRLGLIGAETGMDYWDAAPLQGVSDVPEPSTYALFGSGLVGLVCLRRRK